MDFMALTKWIKSLYFRGLGSSVSMEYSLSHQNLKNHK